MAAVDGDHPPGKGRDRGGRRRGRGPSRAAGSSLPVVAQDADQLEADPPGPIERRWKDVGPIRNLARYVGKGVWAKSGVGPRSEPGRDLVGRAAEQSRL